MLVMATATSSSMSVNAFLVFISGPVRRRNSRLSGLLPRTSSRCRVSERRLPVSRVENHLKYAS